jgi:hypothetical protein
MLSRIFDKLRALWGIRALQKHPVYQAAMFAIQKEIYGDSRAAKELPHDQKEALVERALRDVGEVIDAPNPVMANREKFASSVLEMSKYLVLVLPSPDEPEKDVTGFRGRPGITGELRSHLLEIAEKDTNIRELARILGSPTFQDLHDACLSSYWVAGFMGNLFNTTRIALGDYHTSPEKDWYRPFVAAMCAWEEFQYREAIGLPDVLATQDEYGDLAAVKYSTFLDIVMSGATYPNLEWEKRYKREHA